jgi:hypothetical protein
MPDTRHIHSSGLTFANMAPKLLDKVGHSVSISGQRAKGILFLIVREATVVFDIGAEDGGEFTLKTFFCHGGTPRIKVF